MVDIYVSTTGNDSNVGTRIDKPFLTPTKADSIATPGDTIHVLPGTYTFGGTFITTAAGTASSPITWLGTGATFSGTMNDLDMWDSKGNFVIIFGFSFTGTLIKFGLVNYGHHNRMLYCSAQDCGTALASTPGGGFFDYTGQTLIGFNEWGYNTCLRCGPIASNLYHGLYISTENVFIHDNICSNCAGWGVNFEKGSNGLIAHNLCHHNTFGGFAMQGLGSAGDFNVFANNIAYNNNVAGSGISGNGFIEQNSAGAHNVYDSNCTRLNGNVDYANVVGPVLNRILSDPQFVNYQVDGSGDYHIKSTSPCVDSGARYTGLPLLAYDGNRRPSGAGFDIGPYELTQIAYHG